LFQRSGVGTHFRSVPQVFLKPLGVTQLDKMTQSCYDIHIMNGSVDLLCLKKDTKKLTSTEAQILTISGKGMAI